MSGGSFSRFLHRRTGLEKTLCSFSGILLFTCLIMIAVTVIHRNGSFTSSYDTSICKTNLCIKTAGDIMSKADFTANPCDDFYQYACGNYERTHFAPIDHSKNSIAYEASNAVLLEIKEWLETTSSDDTSVDKKAKVLYKSCMNFDQDPQNILAVLNQAFKQQNLSVWPVLEPGWNEAEGKLEETLAYLTLLDIPIVVQMQIIPDIFNEGQFITRFSPGKPFFEDGHEKKDNLHRSLETVLLELDVKKKMAPSAAEDIISHDRNIFKLKQTADSECSGNSSLARDLSYERLKSLSQMSAEMYSSIAWDKFLKLLFESLGTKDMPDFPVEMFCRRHIRDLNDALYGFSPMSAFNYFGWRFVTTFLQYLGPKFHWIHEFSKYQINGKGMEFHPTPIWKSCISIVNEHLFPVLVNAYRNKSVTEEVLKEKLKIASAIRTTLYESFSKAEWLSDVMKQKLKQKVTKAQFELPLAKVPTGIQTVDDWFSNLHLVEDHIVLNILRLKRFHVESQLRKLIAPSEKHLEWSDTALVSDGNLKYTGGNIEIYFDKIRRPYLSEDQQSYMNFGGFGTFLARELTRLSETIRFNVPGSGNGTFWDEFARRAPWECMTNSDEDKLLSGDKDGSDFARNAALRELSVVQTAYKAYQDNKMQNEALLPGINLTHSQLFFLSYAQGMCEAKDTDPKDFSVRQRVNFAVKHTGAFSSAFSCPADSPMNPSKKCRLW